MIEAAAVLYDLLAQAGIHIPQKMSALGLNSKYDVEVGAEETIEYTAIRTFKPLRLYIPETCGYDFDLMSFLINGEEQLEAGTRINLYGSFFWPMTVCPKGQVIALRVRNRGGASRSFYGILFGEAEG